MRVLFLLSSLLHWYYINIIRNDYKDYNFSLLYLYFDESYELKQRNKTHKKLKLKKKTKKAKKRKLYGNSDICSFDGLYYIPSSLIRWLAFSTFFSGFHFRRQTIHQSAKALVTESKWIKYFKKWVWSQRTWDLLASHEHSSHTFLLSDGPR